MFHFRGIWGRNSWCFFWFLLQPCFVNLLTCLHGLINLRVNCVKLVPVYWFDIFKKVFHKFSKYMSILIYKLIWIVLAFWLVNKCSFIALWSMKMPWAIWLAPSCLWSDLIGSKLLEFTVIMKEIKLYIRASYNVFFFVSSESNYFIKKIKYIFRAFMAR